MDMLVRIQVSRIPSHEASKLGPLASYFGLYRFRIVRRHHGIQRQPFSIAKEPLAEVQMKSDTDPAVGARVNGGRPGGRLSHHETGAGQNSGLGRLNDSEIGRASCRERV